MAYEPPLKSVQFFLKSMARESIDGRLRPKEVTSGAGQADTGQQQQHMLLLSPPS